MKSFYWILFMAIFLEAVALPWIIGGTLYPKLVITILPFAFLFLPSRSSKIFFILVLIYLRTVSSFNLGFLFLGLLAVLFFEQGFMARFFHKTSWRTLVFSSFGIIIFYAIIFAFQYIIFRENLLSQMVFLEIGFTVIISIPLNFLFSKLYRYEI